MHPVYARIAETLRKQADILGNPKLTPEMALELAPVITELGACLQLFANHEVTERTP